MHLYGCVSLFFCLVLMHKTILVHTESYHNNDYGSSDLENYVDDLEILEKADKRSPLISVFRRACIRRGGHCDHRPNDCCYNSSCRCNLWGSNCRCQRMGLFQKWG